MKAFYSGPWMKDDPGSDRAIWATLGPLAASWLIVATLIGIEAFQAPPRRSELFVTFGFWLLVTVPHLLFAAAVWLGGRDVAVFQTAFLHAWAYLILAVVLSTALIIDGIQGEVMGILSMFAGFLWLCGWPVGYFTFRKARTASKPPPPPEV